MFRAISYIIKKIIDNLIKLYQKIIGRKNKVVYTGIYRIESSNSSVNNTEVNNDSSSKYNNIIKIIGSDNVDTDDNKDKDKKKYRHNEYCDEEVKNRNKIIDTKTDQFYKLFYSKKTDNLEKYDKIMAFVIFEIIKNKSEFNYISELELIFQIKKPGIKETILKIIKIIDNGNYAKLTYREKSSNGDKITYRLVRNFKDFIKTIEIIIIGTLEKSENIDNNENNIYSDKNEYYLIKNIENVEIEEIENKNDQYSGGYFPYYNTSFIDLSRFGIVKQNEIMINKEHCIILALRNSGKIDDKEIETIKNIVKDFKFKKRDLFRICKKIDISIALSTVNKIGLQKKYYYNKGKQIKLELGLFKGHYFINDYINVHPIVAKNFENNVILSNKNRNKIFNFRKNKNGNIIKNTIKYRDNYTCKPIKILAILMKNNAFKRIKFKKMISDYYFEYKENMNCSCKNTDSFYENIIKITQEDLNKGEIVKNRKSKVYSRNTIAFADIETTTDGEKHEAFMISHRYYNEKETFTFKGKNCIIDFLESLKKYTLLYFHNAKYDSSALLPYINIISTLKKDGRKYETKAKYTDKNGKVKTIVIHDSYMIIPKKLSECPRMFNLNYEKEPMPYALYTQENVFKDKIATEIALKYLKDSEKQSFLKNILISGAYIDENYFNHIKYCEFYNLRDVEILHDSMFKFDKMLNQNYDISEFDFLTISALSHENLINKGCYENVYNLKDAVRKFVEVAAIGGRTFTRKNKKYFIKNAIEILDVVSLYPTAMLRIKGFPTGNPCIYDVDNPINLNEKPFYIVQIRIKSYNFKDYDIPIFSYLNYKKERIWTNEIPNNIIVTVDNITLEDYIKSYNIKYEILAAIYWKTYNPRINNITKETLDQRMIYKAQKNPLNEVIKLLLNSCYGKTLQKQTTEKYIMVENDKVQEILLEYDDQIKSIYKINQFCSEVRINYNDFAYSNLVHCGSSILSMSKVIMNEIIRLAYDIKVKLYYTDTDSFFIESKDIDRLNLTYKELYNKELIGNKYGQFEREFGIDKATNKLIFAQLTIILGKKAYYCKLSNGTYKFRLKGISPNAILEYCKKNNITLEKFYTKLYNGEKIVVNLCDGSVNFSYTKEGYAYSKKEFLRTVQFNDKILKKSKKIKEIIMYTTKVS